MNRAKHPLVCAIAAGLAGGAVLTFSNFGTYASQAEAIKACKEWVGNGTNHFIAPGDDPVYKFRDNKGRLGTGLRKEANRYCDTELVTKQVLGYQKDIKPDEVFFASEWREPINRDRTITTRFRY